MISSFKFLISVVVATRNEAHNLIRLVQSIKQQTLKNWEIILIDNSQNAQTIEAARSAGIHKIYKFKPEKNILNFRGAQVNLGVKKSQGQIIFFTDADMTFDKELFAEIAEKMNQYHALYIPEVIMGKGYFGMVRKFERSFYDMTPIDAIRVLKKSLFEKISGFDEKNIAFGADDWDLTKRIKQVTNKLGITENKLYHQEGWLTWKTYIQKKGKYTNCFAGYITKWGKNDPEVKKQLGLWYRAFGVFTENGKWKKLFTHPHLALGMYALRLITWLNYQYAKN